MKPNKKTEIPYRHVFIDTETVSVEIEKGMQEQRLKIGWCCFSEIQVREGRIKDKWLEFREPNKLWEFIDGEIPTGCTCWIWAHNMDFDFRVCKGFTELQALGYNIKKFVFETGRVFIKWHKPGKTINIVDTLNYFKVSLEALGESIGLRKGKVDFGTVSDEKLSVYCHRDVEIIRKAIIDLLEFIYENDFGSFKPTVAAQAFAAFRHKFMEFPLWIHNNATADSMEVDAYKGGRSEAFFIGCTKRKRLRCLDVNSMYPSIMQSKELPTKLVKIVSGPSVKELRAFMRKYLVIADMEFYIEQPAVGVKRDRLMFPIGHIRETITSPEIELVLQHGIINKIYRICLYEHEKVFKKYVEKMYELRGRYKKEGNFSYQLFCKYLLNSLYGKFGQRIAKFEDVEANCSLKDNFILNYYDADLKKHVTEYHFGGRVWMKGAKGPSFDTFTAAPAFITGYARCYLWELINMAGKDEVYYVDTDSLFLTRRGMIKLKDYLDEGKLGYLGVEDKKIVKIRNVKDYDTEKEKKIKGIRKDAKRIGLRRYEQIQFEKVLTGGRNERTERVVIKKVNKMMSKKYNKGTVQPDGKVKPFVLKEW